MNALRKWFKRYKPIEQPPVTPESLLERLDEPFRSALLSMYHGEPQTEVSATANFRFVRNHGANGTSF